MRSGVKGVLSSHLIHRLLSAYPFLADTAHVEVLQGARIPAAASAAIFGLLREKVMMAAAANCKISGNWDAGEGETFVAACVCTRTSVGGASNKLCDPVGPNGSCCCCAVGVNFELHRRMNSGGFVLKGILKGCAEQNAIGAAAARGVSYSNFSKLMIYGQKGTLVHGKPSSDLSLPLVPCSQCWGTIRRLSSHIFQLKQQQGDANDEFEVLVGAPEPGFVGERRGNEATSSCERTVIRLTCKNK